MEIVDLYDNVKTVANEILQTFAEHKGRKHFIWILMKSWRSGTEKIC